MNNSTLYGDSAGSISGLLDIDSRYLSFPGVPPFNGTAGEWGESETRGHSFTNARYHDLNAAQHQRKSRQHFTGRFGFIVFAAAGLVWRFFDQRNLDCSLWAAEEVYSISLYRQDSISNRMETGYGRHLSPNLFLPVIRLQK